MAWPDPFELLAAVLLALRDASSFGASLPALNGKGLKVFQQSLREALASVGTRHASANCGNKCGNKSSRKGKARILRGL